MIGLILIGAGVAFFATGTLGLIRFPDLYCRLHALTKADNVGLGLVCAGLAVHAADWRLLSQLLLIWLLCLVAAAVSCYLIGSHAHRIGVDDSAKSDPP